MPNTAFEIRPVRESEYEALGNIIVDSYLHDGFLLGPDDPYGDYLRDVGSRVGAADTLAAVEGERVLGGVTVVPPGSALSEIAGAGEAEIRALAVAPAGRGRGVGAALAAACVEHARMHEAKRIVLSSLPVMKAAHRVYGRLGFERAPDLDWEPIPDVLLWGFALEL